MLSVLACADRLETPRQQPVLKPATESRQPPPISRVPAPVMTFHGAGWLERPEREVEEKPERVLDVMNLKEGDVVAEIGCGTGYFARRMARRVGRSGKVYAEDIQPEMLALLREYVAAEKLTNVTPVLGTETDPKLPDNSLQWVLLVDVYHEFQNPEPMLAAIRKDLAPDGRVALVEYRREGATADHIRLEHRMSVDEVKAEWLPRGFELVSVDESLPSQHLFIFRKAE